MRWPWTPLLLGALLGCERPEKESAPLDEDADGWAADEDCDDLSAAVSPEAAERCNGLDDDCDGLVDEPGAPDGLAVFLDADGDGYGAEPVIACEGSAGTARQPGDCADEDAAISPLATELCDGVDNDCDGLVDEPGSPDGALYPVDADGDGYGHPLNTGLACGPGDGYAEQATDCDDGDPTRSPAAPENCENGQDDDCDGEVDERGDEAEPVWYLDADGDGHGGDAITVEDCAPPLGYTPLADDCDDEDPTIFPGAHDDDSDDIDNDCDGEVDERGDMVGEGKVTYEEGSRRTGCSLVWTARWEEIYPPPMGNYAWRAVQTYDASASTSPSSCDHALRGQDFTWTVAFFWDSFGGEAQTLWVREEGSALWLPLFGANLRRSQDDLLFSSSASEGDTEGTFSGEIDWIGF